MSDMSDTSDKHQHESTTQSHHGNTPAAWTTVGLLLAVSVVAGLAIVIGNWWLFFIAAVGGTLVALLAGKIMHVVGLGGPRPPRHSPAEVQEIADASSEGSKIS
ncbi:HGxxPAAW family protein [Actinopolymorpha sp. NPDC004070]|uniref:HGxxPAAW family protein n=1 Tax=Actinopolymorpha sp. NPDC004070 TaxID=3154548 RepID=UPI00339E834B